MNFAYKKFLLFFYINLTKGNLDIKWLGISYLGSINFILIFSLNSKFNSGALFLNTMLA